MASDSRLRSRNSTASLSAAMWKPLLVSYNPLFLSQNSIICTGESLLVNHITLRTIPLSVANMEFSRLGSWSRDRILKVLVLVLMPKVSVLVLVLRLGLGLGIVFWQLNNDFVLRCILSSSSLHVIISARSSYQMLLLPKLHNCRKL